MQAKTYRVVAGPRPVCPQTADTPVYDRLLAHLFFGKAGKRHTRNRQEMGFTYDA